MLKRLGMIFALTLTFALAAFDVMLIPTLMVNIEDQVKFVPSEHGVYIHTVRQVGPGQPFHLKLALSLKEPAAEPLKISGALFRRAPGGSVGQVFSERVLFDIPAGVKGVFFSPVAVTAHFAEDDAEGSYEWILQYSGSAKNGKVSAALKLVESIFDSAEMDEAGFNRFFHSYYRAPQPERVFAALKYFLTHGEALMRQKKQTFNPGHIVHGFVQIFKLNPQFHDELAKATVNCPAKERLYYALIFAGLGKDAVMAQKELIDPQVQVQIAEFAGKNPLAFTDVKVPAHLDMLWMEFFVTGKFEPVRRIAAELRKREGMTLRQAQAKVKSGQQLTDDEKKLLTGQMVQYAADWSLTSNIKQGNVLISHYLQSIVRKKLIQDNGYIGGRIAAILLKSKSSSRSNR